MSFATKTRQSSVITLVVMLFLLTTAVFAFADSGTPTGGTDATATAQNDATAATSGMAVGATAVSSPPHGCDQAGQGPGSPYDSTCDGSPSGNGNGNGNATGKPCAGCVGAADNKNPPGQFPDGSDHNNGYECDGNHGIGRTNPAHTGCAATTTTLPVTTTTAATTTTVAGTTSTTMPATTTSVLGTTIVQTTTIPPTTTLPCEATTTTTGECESTTTTARVLGSTLVNNGGLGKPHRTPVLPKRTPPDRVLPFTGSDPSPYIGIAGVLMALGGSLVLASRRRRVYGL